MPDPESYFEVYPDLDEASSFQNKIATSRHRDAERTRLLLVPAGTEAKLVPMITFRWLVVPMRGVYAT